MPKVTTGSELREFLAEQAAKRENLLEQAAQIQRDVFDPLGIDPSKLTTGKVSRKASRKSGGKRAPKGAQAETILQLLAKNGGSITTKMAIEAFEKAGYNTAANAVLMRMKREKLVANPDRGVWTTGKKSK